MTHAHKQLKDTLYNEWTTYVRRLAAASPLWATYHTGNQQKINADRAVQTLQTMLKRGLFPDNPQAKAVKVLLEGYEVAEQQYIAAGATFDYTKAQKEVSQAWYSYLTGIKTSYPQLKPVIESVFEYSLEPPK